MPQTSPAPAFKRAIETLNDAFATFGSAELGRRADVAESTVRGLGKKGFRPKAVRTVEKLLVAAETLKAELAER